MEKKRRKK
uniref:Uncharacterized protein n=1 Tax=Bos taurus TaxID=9913 RepID=A0AAA9S596_BOVIN